MKSYAFNGCCGGVQWMLADSGYTTEPVEVIEKELHRVAKEARGNNPGLAVMILNDDQKGMYEKTLMDFGFRKFRLDGAVNPKTRKLLFGYHYDINGYGKERLKKSNLR